MLIKLQYSKKYPLFERKMRFCAYYPSILCFIFGRFYTGLSTKEAKRLSDILQINLHPTSKYWLKFSVCLDTLKPLHLDITKPSDEFKYLFLSNHKKKHNYIIFD